MNMRYQNTRHITIYRSLYLQKNLYIPGDMFCLWQDRLRGAFHKLSIILTDFHTTSESAANIDFNLNSKSPACVSWPKKLQPSY